MYYVLHRKSAAGYHLAFCLIRERDREVANARIQALIDRGEQVVALRVTDDYAEAHELLTDCRSTVPNRY